MRLVRLIGRRVRRDDQGSMIMAIMIIVALSVTITALLTTVQGGLRLARVDQDRTTAFQHANGGIDHVLYRLDQSGGRLSGTYLPPESDPGANPRYQVVSCTGGETPPCTTGIAEFTDYVPATSSDPMTYTVRARATPAGQTNQWLVESIGCDPSRTNPAVCTRQRKAVATIRAQLLFTDGFFTFDGFDLTGNQGTPVVYCSKPCPPDFATGQRVQYTDKNNTHTNQCIGVPVTGCVVNRTAANFGTNGTLTGSTATVTAFAQLWAGFNMYGRATMAEAQTACGGQAPDSTGLGLCGQAGATVRHFTDQQQIVTPRVPARPQGCPNGGIVTGTIPPGNYLCENLTFSGNVTVSGDPVTGAPARFWVRCRLYFSGPLNGGNPREVNVNQVPTRLQIYYDNPTCPGTNDSNLCDTVLFGMLYAPALTINCSGSHQAYVYGQVVARFYSGTGNQFQFFWDLSTSLDLGTGKFRIYDWRECPVATPLANC